MDEVNQKLRQARVSAGLTAQELAEKIGIKRSTYQYWEEKTPSLANIKRVEKALGLPPGYFINDDAAVRMDITDSMALALVENSAMLRVILGLLAEQEAEKRGELVASVFAPDRTGCRGRNGGQEAGISAIKIIDFLIVRLFFISRRFRLNNIPYFLQYCNPLKHGICYIY